MKTRLILLSVAVAVFSAEAAVKLAAPFKDGMVLQRERPAPVWGWANPGERVQVRFGTASVSTVAKGDGRWMVNLPPLKASKVGRTLDVNGVKVRDVLVGEVWFCAGQSNAEFPLCGDNPHFSDRQGRMMAQLTRRTEIRFAHCANYKWSAKPKADFSGGFSKWQTFTPENLGKGRSFSALAFYFAMQLYSAIDVPIGIVGTYWGGTGIDPWIPREGYEGIDSLREVAGFPVTSSWDKSMAKGPIGDAHQQPTVLFNEMVNPWAPFAIRGLIWYQGCNNSGEAHLYCDKMHALYKGWSRKFRNSDLKLYFVQLAPWCNSWFDIQLAQEKFANEEKNAGMVPSCDAGNRDDIHPYEKEILARRLAALALKRDYGFDGIVADYPQLKSWRINGDQFVLTYSNVKKWHIYSPDWEVKVPFEIAGEDGVFKQAFILNANNGAIEKRQWQSCGMVEGVELRVVAPGVPRPKSIRYLYKDPWVGNVFADSGLPIAPMQLTAEGELGGETPPGPVVKRFDDIHIRDPFILEDKGIYYLYDSKPDNDGHGVFVRTSRDLSKWSPRRRVMKVPNGVPCTDVWAPEVHKYKKSYYLFTTVVKQKGAVEIKPMGKDAKIDQLQPRGTWVFKSNSPLGPFVPVKKGPIPPESQMTLDGTLYVEDGKPYMVYCHEWIQTGNGKMMRVPLSEDLSSFAGEPVEMFNALGGVHGGWVVTDGPFFWKSPQSGKLHMIWSNMVFMHGYCVLVRTSDSGRLEGPWSNSEILFGENGGHGMIFESSEKNGGKLYMSLHQPNDGGRERLNLFELEERDGKLGLKLNNK